MQDLYEKLDQLKKALLSVKSSQQKNPLVPALKPPTLKPLSISSAAPAKPISMPGVSPSSNKDPVKMAEQLKNPKPKKPKIEVLKVEKNGQWSLEKFGENNSV